MKRLILAALAALCMAAKPAAAAWPNDTITSRYGFIVPSSGTAGYALKINDWAIKADTMTASLFAYDVFNDSASWLQNVSVSSDVYAYDFMALYGIKASTGMFSGQVTAGSFSGSGSGLTGISESGVTNLTSDLAAKATDASVVHLAGSENISGAKTFQATGASVYSVTSSSGIQVQAGTLQLQGQGGLDAGATGIKASTGTFTASGNTQYSIYASSGINAPNGCINLTGGLVCGPTSGGGGGGGTVTTQGSPQAGQVPIFQAGTVLSSSPISVAYGAGGASTMTITASAANFEILIASMDISNVKVATFTYLYGPSAGQQLVLMSSTSYRIHYSATAGGSTTEFLASIGGDFAQHYAYSGQDLAGIGSGASGGSGFLGYGIALNGDDSSTGIAAGASILGDARFETVYGSSSTVGGLSNSSWVRTLPSTWITWQGRIGYNNSLGGKTLSVFGSSSANIQTTPVLTAISGHFELWQGATHQ